MTRRAIPSPPLEDSQMLTEISAAICFGLSAGFHTLRSHSYNIYHLRGRMDILGICFLALGARASMTYHAFHCRSFIQRVYWGLNLFSAIGAAITLFDTGYGGNKMRTLRGGVFSLLAVSAMLPILQNVIELGWTCANNENWGWMVSFKVLYKKGRKKKLLLLLIFG